MKIIKERICSLFKSESVERSGIINLVLRPVSLLLALLYTPLLLSYLGTEKYGLWATVLSIISWINYFDVGIGNGLRNLIPKLLVEENYSGIKRAVSTAYIILVLISSGILIVLLVACNYLDWYSIFSTNIDMRMPLIISFIFICVNFVLAIGNILLYAFQLSEKVALRNVLVQGLNIIGITILSAISKENIVLVAIMFGITQLAVNVFNILTICKGRKYLIPSVTLFDKKYLSFITSIGIKFFIIQIMCLAMFTVDDLLITHFWGAEANTPFSISNKVFNTLYSVFAAFTLPYWSGTTRAMAQKDTVWIKKSIKKIEKVFLLFCIAFIGMIFMFKPAVFMWLHRELEFQSGLIPLMSVFYILYSILNIECQFLNGMNDISLQLILYIIAGTCNIPFSIFLGVTCKMNLVGVRLATLLLVFLMIIVLGTHLHRKLKTV